MRKFKSGKTGKTITLLNPNEKGRKAAYELKHGIKYTNAGQPKVNKLGEIIVLNKTERAYRAGYLAARKDSGKAYKAKQRRNGILVVR